MKKFLCLSAGFIFSFIAGSLLEQYKIPLWKLISVAVLYVVSFEFYKKIYFIGEN